MGTFKAALRAIGDVKTLPATVKLEEGWLSIAAGQTEIGAWPLSEITLEPIPTGYRMAAEGEQILIELKDIDSFNETLKEVSKRRFRIPGLGRQAKPTAPQPSAEPASRTEPAPAIQEQPRPERRVTLSPTPESETAKKGKQEAKGGWTRRGLALVDGTLSSAEKRFGAYLPEWVFTRIMFGVAFVALILMIVFPTLVSSFMLIAGALIVVFGAVVYSDPMLASRWLPGRTTPPHVLMFGVAILMLGVLLGVVAN
jgi:hypothetical protein